MMKILRGDLTETRYAFPETEGQGPMEVISERTHKENEVAYMADELGVHRIWNKGSDFAVSLHRRCSALMIIPAVRVANTSIVYTPPNVAKGGCNIFDQKTGKKSHITKCGYYSAYGRLLKE